MNFENIVNALTTNNTTAKASAEYELAKLYISGDEKLGINRDFSIAAELLTDAVNYDEVNSPYLLAQFYFRGESVAKDEQKAVELIKKSAANGHIDSMLQLAICHHLGQFAEQDYQKARDLYLQLDKANIVKAQFNLAIMYENAQGIEQDVNEAIKYYTKAGENGHLEAQIKLGNSYKASQSTVGQDLAKAFSWYHKAASHVAIDPKNEYVLKAQQELGVMYLTGEGVEANPQKAIELLSAVEIHQSNHIIEFLLAKEYLKGENIEQDLGKAISLLDKSSKQGNTNASLYLGLLHEEGIGVKKNIVAAINYYSKAGDNELAQSLLNDINSSFENKSDINHGEFNISQFLLGSKAKEGEQGNEKVEVDPVITEENTEEGISQITNDQETQGEIKEVVANIPEIEEPTKEINPSTELHLDLSSPMSNEATFEEETGEDKEFTQEAMLDDPVNLTKENQPETSISEESLEFHTQSEMEQNIMGENAQQDF